MERAQDRWLQLAANASVAIALISPIVGLAFLAGYLANFGVDAWLVVGLEDVALASIAAAIGLSLVAFVWWFLGAFFDALMPLASDRYVRAALLLNGLLFGAILLFDASTQRTTGVNLTTVVWPAIGAVTSLALGVFAWVLWRRQTRWARVVALLLISIVAIGLGVRAPYEMGLSFSFYTSANPNLSPTVASSEGDHCALVWSGARARVDFCSLSGARVTFVDDGVTYRP